MRVARILLVLLAVLFLASFPLDRRASSSDAQTPQAAAPTLGPSAARPLTIPADPPGTIDGAKNPELIPDNDAYRVVLLALAEPEDATDAQKARFQAKIASAGLNADHTQALARLLAAFQKQLDALNAQMDQIRTRSPILFPGTPDYQKLVDLTKQTQPVFAEAMSAVPATLSADGAAKFLAYVRNAKRGMKSLPESPMPPQ